MRLDLFESGLRALIELAVAPTLGDPHVHLILSTTTRPGETVVRYADVVQVLRAAEDADGLGTTLLKLDFESVPGPVARAR